MASINIVTDLDGDIIPNGVLISSLTVNDDLYTLYAASAEDKMKWEMLR